MVNRANTYSGKHVAYKDLLKLTQMVWAAKTGKGKHKPKYRLASSPLSEYEGAYEVFGQAKVILKGATLTVDDGLYGEFDLQPVGKDWFLAKDARFFVKFIRDEQGRLMDHTRVVRKPIAEILEGQ